MKKLLIALVALLTLSGAFVAPAESQTEKQYFVVEEALPFEALDGATAYWGVLKDAGYRIEVPDHWNGHLVMWAHGYAGTGLELFVQNPPDGDSPGEAEFRQSLIAQGYAWAASSYSKNDYNIRTPAAETRQLAKRFKQLTGMDKPDEIYLAGVSMGGNITAFSAQRYEDFYDGFLPVCGALSDLDLFNYFADFNLAAQTLGGAGTFPVDPVAWLSPGGQVDTIKANLSAVEGGWPIVLNEDGQNLKNLTELRSGGDRPNFDEGWAFWNSQFTDPGGNFLFNLAVDTGTVPVEKNYLTNEGVVYQFDTNRRLTAAERQFNEDVQRLQRDRLNRRDRFEIPRNTGDFEQPMLSMHNLGDLFVPYSNEVDFAKRVRRNGEPELFVVRAIRGSGHCDFTTAEYDRAFNDLVNWVRNDKRPAGDSLRPKAIADPNYGCRFTDGFHFAAAPCPAPGGPEVSG